MSYAKLDCVQFSLDWIYTSNGDKRNITKYLLEQSSEEGLTIENNKVTFNFKLIKDKLLSDGTIAPFFTDNAGVSRLKTDGLLQPYIAYEDGITPIIDDNNLYKTYYISEWSVDEPGNNLSISGVDLSYKITNRNISQIYNYDYFENSGFTATGTTFTDSSKSFPIPKDDAYDLGLKYKTLELIDEAGDIYLYLITNNTATTCTTHKTIATPSGSWVSYRIGWNAPLALYDAVNRVSRPDNAAGEIYRLINLNLTTNLGADYKGGIQLLRKKGASTEAFPIINIGEPYLPVYKLINEISSYTACNTENELGGNLTIKRDMVFAVVWNDDIKKTDINWFYPDAPEVSSLTKVITNVTTTSVTVTNSDSNDVGKLARIKKLSGDNIYYKTYTITDVTGSTYTLSSNPIVDGVAIDDEMKVISGVDFIWDNEEDFKHIYSLKLGSKDEEKFNTVYFNAGTNDVAGTDITGLYFYDETKSDTLKDTFIPMTGIAKNMMQWVTTGADGIKKVLKKEGDTWFGWDSSASDFTSTTTDWEFTTTFGTDTTYTIDSRTSFNSSFRDCAKKAAKIKSRAICVNQKENTLSGTIIIRGQKFIKVSELGSTISKWYDKGTRILFSKPDAGLANEGGKYYLFIVNKVRHTIDSSTWRTSLDVTYDLYDLDELVKTNW